jgi:hypothetical protein
MELENKKFWYAAYYLAKIKQKKNQRETAFLLVFCFFVWKTKCLANFGASCNWLSFKYLFPPNLFFFNCKFSFLLTITTQTSDAFEIYSPEMINERQWAIEL